MSVEYTTKYAVGPNEGKHFDTAQLREAFLMEGLFKEDKSSWFTPTMIAISLAALYQKPVQLRLTVLTR